MKGGDGRKGKWLLIYNLPWRTEKWEWKERKVVATLQPPARGGLEVGYGRKGKWLLIYNLPWKVCRAGMEGK